jgi:CheY-like chemotaxis protein
VIIRDFALNVLTTVSLSWSGNEMPRVLCVDDDSALLRLTSIYFREDEQIKIVGVSSPVKALELLETDDFDMIVSDYQMPDMDGISFLKELRESGNSIPFILCSWQMDEKLVIEAINQGADTCLQKGIDLEVQFMGLRKAMILLTNNRTFENGFVRSEPVSALCK